MSTEAVALLVPGLGENEATPVQTSGNRKMTASAPLKTQKGICTARPARFVGARRPAGRVRRAGRLRVVVIGGSQLSSLVRKARSCSTLIATSASSTITESAAAMPRSFLPWNATV